MNKAELIEQIKIKRSFLCVGLDSDLSKIPSKFLKYQDPILEFNKVIIEVASPYCVAIKPNTAFYERNGAKGWQTLEQTFSLIPENVFKIADAKRGDIGNTSDYYAQAFFNQVGADALTIAPYMGADSVSPFLNHPNKWAIVLAITSNQGSIDFQQLELKDGRFLFEEVVRKSIEWSTSGSLMFVVGATRSEFLAKMRFIAPDYFFLVPGVGAQGGSLSEVANLAMNDECGLLVNASRSIIYPTYSDNFEQAVENACIEMQHEMEQLLLKKAII
jgi:orotidine-5'-phosphate decarboxylase